MRNVLIIWRKELRSYFASPIAYLLLTMFALIFGFFFWNALGYFVLMGMESQMRGQMFPMNLNEEVIRPLLSNASVIGLFFIPMITMRLFAEEKRTGTIELLATSPVRDLEIILGKWLAAMTLYATMLLFTALNFAFLFKYGNPDWKPLAIGCFKRADCWQSELSFQPSPRTRSSPARRRLEFACCCGFWSGSAVMRPRPGQKCFPICP